MQTFRSLRRDTRVFISAVSSELGTVRDLIKKALEDNDYHAVEQKTFPPDYRELIEKLRSRIDSCDAVIHVAGFRFGSEPRQRPQGNPRRSYTQLEHDLARELEKPVYVFITDNSFPTDSHDPEDPEKTSLQDKHRTRLTETDFEYARVSSRETLDQRIRSIQFRCETLLEELTGVDDKATVIHQVVQAIRSDQAQLPDIILQKLTERDSSAKARGDIEFVRELVQQKRFIEALPLLDRLRDREWQHLEPDSRYEVLASFGLVYHAREEFTKAAEAFIAAHQHKPHAEKPRCFEAIGYHLLGNRGKAFELAAKVREDFPESVLAAAVWIRTAGPENKLNDLQRGIPESVQTSSEVAAALADRATEICEFAAAEEYARIAFAAAPESPDVLALLGNSILQRVLHDVRTAFGNGIPPAARQPLQEAVDHFTQALVLFDAFAPKIRLAGLLFNRATALRFLGHEARYKEDLIAAFAQSPRIPEIAARYAFQQAEEGSNDAAIDVLRRYRQGGDPSVHVDTVLAWFLNQRNSGDDRKEAIELLESWRARLLELAESTQIELVGAICEAYVDAGRAEDAHRLVTENESLLPLAASLLFRSRLERIGANPAVSVQLLREAAKHTTGQPELAVKIARELQRQSYFSDALTIYKRMVSPACPGTALDDMLYCAYRVEDHQSILETCLAFREYDNFEPRFVILEAQILATYGDYGQAIDLVQRAIAAVDDGPISSRLSLNLASLAARAQRADLVPSGLLAILNAHEIEPEDACAAVSALRSCESPAAAAQFAYKTIRKHFNNEYAHAAMIAAILESHDDAIALPMPAAAGPDSAVIFQEDGEHGPRFLILESEPDPAHERCEISQQHPLAAELRGKRPGDTFVVNPGNLAGRRATVLEVIPKEVARFRDSLSNWYERFPNRRFIERMDLPSTSQGELDFTPLLKAIDKRTEGIERCCEAYRRHPLPIHVFTQFGHDLVECTLHTAADPALRLRCTDGSPLVRQAALQSFVGIAKLVLDPTAIATLLWLDQVNLLCELPDLCVSTGTLELVRSLRERLRRDTGSIGKQGERYFVVSPDDPAHRQQRQRFDEQLGLVIGALETRAKIESGLCLANLSAEMRGTLDKLFGRASAESMLLAAKPDRLLWTDDLVHGLIAGRDFGAKRIWTDVLLEQLMRRGAIQRSTFLNSLVRLHQGGYEFTPLSPELLLHGCRVGGWSAKSPEANPLLRHLTGTDVDSRSILLLLAKAVPQLYCEAPDDEVASEVFREVLTNVSLRKDGLGMIAALYRHLGAIFEMDVTTCRRARLAIETWRASHRAL